MSLHKVSDTSLTSPSTSESKQAKLYVVKEAKGKLKDAVDRTIRATERICNPFSLSP
jgi:hypothetical protein